MKRTLAKALPLASAMPRPRARCPSKRTISLLGSRDTRRFWSVTYAKGGKRSVGVRHVVAASLEKRTFNQVVASALLGRDLTYLSNWHR